MGAPAETTWTYQATIRKRATTHTGMRIRLHWSLKAAVPLSSRHAPATMPAARLLTVYLQEWVPRISESCGLPAGWVPIFWTVDATGPTGVEHFETAPFQPPIGPPSDPHAGQDPEAGRGWLECFTWPTSEQTGRRLNWLQLPVADYRWNTRRADPGGFVQEALGGWKPRPSEIAVDVARLAEMAGFRAAA